MKLLQSFNDDKLSISLPPFLVIHGEKDAVVPIETSNHFIKMIHKFRRRLDANAIMVDNVISVPLANHNCEAFLNTSGVVQLSGVSTWLSLLARKNNDKIEI